MLDATDLQATKSSDVSMKAVPSFKSQRWRRLLWIAAAMLLLVVLAPTIAQISPLRDWLLAGAAPGLNGSISAARAEFGWLSPVRVRDLVIRDPDGTPVLEIPELSFDASLWTLVTGGEDWGRLRVVRPRLHVIVARDRTTNLQRVFGQMRRSNTMLERLRGRRLEIELVDAQLTVRTPHAAGNWEAGKVNFAALLRSEQTPQGLSPQLEIKPSKLLDRTEITPGLCESGLKFVLPPLAEATSTEGAVSIDLNAGIVPLERPRKASVSGAVTIHTVAIGPGTLTESLSDLLAALNTPAKLSLAENSVVKFDVKDERVSHSGLEFGIPQLRVRTEGSVGFDQSLDLVAELVMALGQSDKIPWLAALGNQNVRIPIGGTLLVPVPKLESMALANPNWLNILRSGANLVMRQRGTPSEEAAAETEKAGTNKPAVNPADIVENLPIGNGQLLNWWNQRRKQRGEQRATPPQQEASTESPPPEPPPRRRLFDRLRSRAEAAPR